MIDIGNFTESPRVRHLECIYARVDEVSEIEQVSARKHRTKNFPCGIVFIINILRLNAFFNEQLIQSRILQQFKQVIFRRHCKQQALSLSVNGTPA